ncbi:MAG TPA: isochorismatase family cysteine hydrolase [Stellaceae bacterium]|nr:isochorismatase family cysteine hydrolase [Stellaceae bacterium]
MHKIDIPQYIIDRVTKARGKLHAFDQLVGPATALLVVDLQNVFMLPPYPTEVPLAREIVPNVNRLAAATRAAGGAVVWIQMTHTENDKKTWSVFYEDVTQTAIRGDKLKGLLRGSHGQALYDTLDVKPGDLKVEKNRFSAFIQGSSDLDKLLKARGIDTVLVTGTVTNTCCESTARDAMMLNYKTVMVSDANAAATDAEHNATLANILRIFGDVMSTDEVIARLAAAKATAAE